MHISRLIGAILIATPGLVAAQESMPTEAVSVQSEAEAQPDLADLLWVARPLVVFADSPNDPRFGQQLDMLDAGAEELGDRLVVVLTDSDPEANGPLRRELRPRGFGLVLIDTDGSVIQRRPALTTVRELTGIIDRLPSRRQEIGSRRQ